MNQKKSVAPGVIILVIGILLAIIGLSMSIWGCSKDGNYTVNSYDKVSKGKDGYYHTQTIKYLDDDFNNLAVGILGGVFVAAGIIMALAGKSSIGAAKVSDSQTQSSEQTNTAGYAGTPTVQKAETPRIPGGGMGVAALILFIAGLVSSFTFFGIPVLIVSIILNAKMVKKVPEHAKTYSIRVVLSMVAILLSIVFLVLYAIFVIPYIISFFSF